MRTYRSHGKPGERPQYGGWVGMVLGLLLTAPWVGPVDTARAQSPSVPLYESASDAPAFPSFGAGIGVPYGVIGGRLGVELSYVGLGVGGGLVPLAWKGAISVSGSVYLLDRTRTVRPKITGAYSNAVAAVVMLDQDDLFDPLYSKLYDGFAAYAGIDWRVGKTSAFCFDVNIGAVFPTVGIDQVNEDSDEARRALESQGYVVDKVSDARSFPFFSLGLTYNPGRSMTRVLP